MATGKAPLPTEAIRVWQFLREQNATSIERARTDREISEATHIHRRTVVKMCRELIRRGIFALADSSHGRWIGTRAQAVLYKQKLANRISGIGARMAAVDEGLREYDAQLPLFPIDALSIDSSEVTLPAEVARAG